MAQSPSPAVSMPQSTTGAPAAEPQSSGMLANEGQAQQAQQAQQHAQQQAQQHAQQQQAQHAQQQPQAQAQLQHQMQQQHQQQQQQLQLQQQAQLQQQQQQHHQQQLHQQQAQQQLYNAWQQQHPQQYLFRTGDADVEVPQMVQQRVQEPPNMQTGDLPPEMRATLQQAQRQAQELIMRSAKLAAIGGVDYQPPAAMAIQLPPIRKTDVRGLEQQLQQVQASRQAMARHQQQLESAMQQLHASPALNGGGGGSGSPADSLHTHSGGMSKAKKPPAGPPKERRGREGKERRAASVKAAEIRQEWLQQEQAEQQEPLSPPPAFRAPAHQGRAPRPQSGAAGQAPRSAGQDEEEAEAWETAPDDKLRLKLKDIKPALQDKWLQVYWPDDNRWWPGRVTDINVRERRVVLLYETNEEEEIDLAELVSKGEVAWLHKKDAAPQRAPPKPRQDSPPLADLDDLPGELGSGDLGLMDGDIFGQLGGGMMMPQQHSAPYGRMPPQHMGGGGMAGPQMMQQHGGQDQRSGFGGGMAGPGGVPGCSPGGGGSGVPGGPQGMAAIFSLGQSAIGAPVHVILVQQNSWYTARIIGCNPAQGSVMVRHEGGRQEVLEAHRENREFRVRLLQMPHMRGPPALM